MPERGGAHRVLELSSVYRVFERLISHPGAADDLRTRLYPELGARPLRVLDIGCGPAVFWSRYKDVHGLTYVGIEPNRAYVDDARARYPTVELHAGTVPEVRDAVHGMFDLVVLEGVLHHIDDEAARDALQFAAARMSAQSRLVAIDPVILDRQNPVARLLARLDRGKNVRTLDGYQRLAEQVFRDDHISVQALSGLLRVPYDHSLLEVVRR
jgi:SAM-dependent methyltransferase